MCNVVQYHFTCNHILKSRRSSCKGTKHKTSATTIKAACSAEAYLTIHMRIHCGPCQHKDWEDNWTTRLQRATTFLEKLRTRPNLPGEQEIAALVKELESEYTTASWTSRNMFPPTLQSSISRVKHGWYTRETSALTRQVRPDDIQELEKAKEWMEMEECDYDGDYIASTDPIHPVDTNYAHLSEHDDKDWITDFLAMGEDDSLLSSDNLPFDDEYVYGCESEDIHKSSQTVLEDNSRLGLENMYDEKSTSNDQLYQKLTDAHPKYKKISQSNTLNPTTPHHNTPDSKEMLEQIIQIFWSTVNNNDKITITTVNTDPITTLHFLSLIDPDSLDNHHIDDLSISAPSVSTPKQTKS